MQATCTVSKCHFRDLSSGHQFPLITVLELDFYIFQASTGEERLRIATDLSTTLSKLHRDDYVQGCLALAEVPSVATLHKFARHSGHKANDNLPSYCKALRFR